MAKSSRKTKSKLSVASLPKAEVLADYKVAFMSRQASVLGRKEVMTGKAKFGIFGDGKEVAQVAMAKAFKKGDWRSGYYRDQTFMFALGATTIKQFFAQLYADTDLQHEPASGGRQMNSHFSTRYLDADGQWLNQLMMYNSSSDMSPTAGQMSRLVGLGYASKLYRENKGLADLSQFSVNGNEVAFGTIGNASAAEGVFWEAINAIGVLQVPVAMSVWDDGYGISVPNKYQMSKDSISKVMQGFSPEKDLPGIAIHVVKGWDYPALVDAYLQGVEQIRKHHEPALFHIVDMTQPQGHSTSGSHERYKDAERMQFEQDFDCLSKMREWMVSTGVATDKEIDQLEKEGLATVQQAKEEAWQEYQLPMETERQELLAIYNTLENESEAAAVAAAASKELAKTPVLMRRVVAASARRTLLRLRGQDHAGRTDLASFVDRYATEGKERYNTWLHSESNRSAMHVAGNEPRYSDKPEKIPGVEILNRYFKELFARDPRVFAIGEDIGHLGGVNQGFKDLQEEFGAWRVTDTGIREATILGQGIGAAMRGLRPIVDIQYLDYLLYCFQVMSDDLATLHYRSAGGQIAPVVVRTKGHRLEGIWHTGSPMGTIIHGLRGVHVCVPRDMVQAIGMYNTLFAGDEPGLVIEVLNGYRIREAVPESLSDLQIPLGVPETLREGSDVTIVTYGACVRIAQDACAVLAELGIEAELIDVRTLLPFDRYNLIGTSLEKTNALVVMDEDVPGGASGYMLQQIIDRGDGYDCLDAPPRTLAAQPHRGAYASDGDYWSKPNAEDLIEMVYDMMHERNPTAFPAR